MYDLKRKLAVATAILILLLTIDASIFAQTKEEKLEVATKIFEDAIILFRQQTAESYRSARVKFREASDLFSLIDHKEEQAVSFLFIGRTSDELGEKSVALESYNQALSLSRFLANRSLEAKILNNIGVVYSDLGENQKAFDYCNQSLLMMRELGDKLGQARSLGTIGMVYLALDEKRKALDYYNQALLLFRGVGNEQGEATSLNNIGLVYSHLEENQKALEYYNQVLPISRATANKGLEATALTGIGAVYYKLGEMQKSLEHYDQALFLVRLIGDKHGEARISSNIGLVYHDLGDNQKALKHYIQALPLHRMFSDKSAEAVTLNRIGSVYLSLMQLQKALEYYNAALLLRRLINDKTGEATTLSSIGLAYHTLGDKQKALDYYGLALSRFQAVGDKRGEATTLTNIGGVRDTLGEKQKALDFYNQALSLFRVIGDKDRQAITLNNIMNIWETQKVSRLAVLYGKQSVNKYQEIRQNIKGLDKQTQNTYLKTIESTYRRLANILIAEGRIAEAEEVLAMLKDEEFFAYLRRDDKVAADLKAKISLSADERKAFEDYEKFADDITRTAAEFGVLERKMNDLPQGASLSAADQADYDRLKKNYDAAVTVFGKFLDDLKVKFGAADKRVATVESNTQNILRELKQPRTVIISTIAGADRLNLIVTTSDIQRAHTVNISATDLNKLVADFRDAVKNPAVDPRPLGKKLYDTLFPAALQKDLDNIKADTIVWSLDGTLRYAPMAALWDGKGYLAERYTNAVLTLAVLGNLNAPRTSRADWRALGVGVSKPFQNFSALPAVPQELCSVVSDPQKKDFCRNFGAKRAGMINGLMLSDEEFTLQTFQNELGKVPIVHIASHFSLNAGDESDSFLLLGGGAERRFSLVNMKKKRLDKVELLTLSACNTAMTAGNNSSGVEVEGFGALAQQQGAKSVLATLWAVADDSTKDLMTEFYGELEKNPSTGKAEALRKAQLKLINGKYKTEDAAKKRGSEIVRFGGNADNLPKYTKDENAPFAHPYFWSPFILFGNWK